YSSGASDCLLDHDRPDPAQQIAAHARRRVHVLVAFELPSEPLDGVADRQCAVDARYRRPVDHAGDTDTDTAGAFGHGGDADHGETATPAGAPPKSPPPGTARKAAGADQLAAAPRGRQPPALELPPPTPP